MRRLYLALALLPACLHAGETEWPQFRGPTGEGISKATGLPLEWSATTHVAWQVEVPGSGWSSPVLSKGKIYLTTALNPAEGEPSLHALCFEAASGKLLWDTEVLKPDPAGMASMHKKNSPASATPIVTNDRLFVHFGHMGTVALDLDGKVLWRQTDLKYTTPHGNGGSPLLLGDTLIFSGDGAPDPFVAGLDVATGAIRWRTPRNTTARKLFSFCTPLAIQVDGKTEVISPGSGFVGAYDPKSGAELWRCGYGEGYSVVPRPIFADGLLFLSSGFDSAWVYAIKPQGASGDVTETNVAWKTKKGAPLTPSMLAVGDELYYISDGGIATCADAKTGEVHWAERLEGNYSASPILAEGRIYFLSESGVGYVVKASPTFELLAKNELGERTLASYVPADGALYIRSESHLWKISNQAGAKTASTSPTR